MIIVMIVRRVSGVFFVFCIFSFISNVSAMSHPNSGILLAGTAFLPSLVFRWFKLTLKPPYSIARDNLRLTIWDTSFWTFWLKFGHKGPLETYPRTYSGHF